jgi:hypothetical protein
MIFIKQAAIIKILLLITLLLFNRKVDAQTLSEKNISISANADLLSRYIWRGTDLGTGPAFQPGFSASYSGFSMGYFGSYNLLGNYKEVNLFISKSVGFATFELWDYWSSEKTGLKGFSDYRSGSTSHMIEGIITLSGNDSFPLSFTGGWLFYGSDYSKSIYLELQYRVPVQNSELSFFTGYQAKGYYYAEKRGFVNVGVTYTQPLVVSNDVSLDLILSLVTNPTAKNVFFTVGLSFYNN